MRKAGWHPPLRGQQGCTDPRVQPRRRCIQAHRARDPACRDQAHGRPRTHLRLPGWREKHEQDGRSVQCGHRGRSERDGWMAIHDVAQSRQEPAGCVPGGQFRGSCVLRRFDGRERGEGGEMSRANSFLDDKPRIYRVSGSWYCKQVCRGYGGQFTRLGVAAQTPAEAYRAYLQTWHMEAA